MNLVWTDRSSSSGLRGKWFKSSLPGQHTVGLAFTDLQPYPSISFEHLAAGDCSLGHQPHVAGLPRH